MTIALLLVLVAVLGWLSWPRMASAVGSCIDRIYVILVDPDTGIPIVSGGAIPVSFAATPITENLNDNVDVTAAASTTILAANAARLAFSIQNFGDADVAVRFAAAVATTDDFVIPSGGAYNQPEPSGFIYRGEIRAIALTAPTTVPNVSVLEWV